MAAVDCPSCNKKLAVGNDIVSGKVKCGQCGATFLVAQCFEHSIDEQSLPPISIDTSPVSPPKSRRFRAIVSFLIHITITGVTIYLGYQIIHQRRFAEPEPKVVREEPVQTRHVPQTIRERPAPIVQPIDKPVAPLPPIVARAPDPPPFQNLPDRISLPSSTNARQFSLFGIGSDAEVLLISQHPSLTLVDNVFYWQQQDGNRVAVAELAIRLKEVLFRWQESVPVEAETVLRNSLIKLSHEPHEHVVSLREPVVLDAPLFDLKKSVQSINCKIEYAPEPGQIWLDLAESHLPHHRIEGTELKKIRIGEEALLWWNGADAAATKVQLVKRGNIAALKLDSRYKLPSGDEEPMSVPRGNRNLKDLNDVLDSAIAAKNTIRGLRSYLSRLMSEARQPTGGYVNGIWIENPVLAARKASLLIEISATENRISQAENLIARKPAIEKELRELQNVAVVARSLHESVRIAYRFYTVVGGHDVNLVIAD